MIHSDLHIHSEYSYDSALPLETIMLPIYASDLFGEHSYEKILGIITLTDKTFGKYFVGAILDSLLVGFICFLLVQLFGMPYAPLIGVVIGITNIIPIFGPFIGAIPSAILVFLISPMQCLYFVILILILQQFDGNILGPKILGNSTGLSSFWVLFSILLFGGLFGFAGMILAVPMTAVIFDLFANY